MSNALNLLSSVDLSNSQFPYAPPIQPPQGITKRRRNRHACDPCRRKRAKCDGNMPCHACIASETTCSYTAPKKRGVPTGFLQKLETSNEKLVSLVSLLIETLDDGYEVVSSIASRIAQESPGETRERYSQSRAYILAMLEVDDFDEMPARNSGSKKLQSQPINPLPNDSDNASSSEFGTMFQSPASVSSSSQPKGFDDKDKLSIISPIPPTSASSTSPIRQSTYASNSETVPVTHTVEESDTGSIVPFETKIKQEVPIPEEPDAPENPAAASSEVRFLGPSSGFDESFYASFERLRLTQARFDVSAWKSIISAYSVMDLLDTYFAYIHPLFPMVEKSKLVQLMYSSDATTKNGANCLLWSTIMMGLNLTNVGTHKQDSYKSRIMHDLTICTLDCKYSLESVQAMLIQGFYFYGKGHWSNSYLIIGNAVRMANVIGLHVSETDNVYARRTWKCCCIIDTLISGRLGREPQVSTDNFFTVPEEETSEEWELWRQPSGDWQKSPENSPPNASQTAEPARTLSIFNRFYELTKLINSLICETNSPRYTKYNDQQKKSLLSRVSYQLDDWAMNMPLHCSFIEYTDTSTSTPNQLLPHKANLLLCFFAFTANLHFMDSSDTLRNCKNILAPETIVNFTLNVCSCYFGRYSAAKTLPTFEYFISLCLSLFVKTAVQGEMQSVNQMVDRDEFTMLLGYLEEICIPWAGATMGFKYFQQMKNKGNGNGADYNSQNQVENPDSPFSSALMGASLDNMSEFADVDSFELLQQTLMVSASGDGYNTAR